MKTRSRRPQYREINQQGKGLFGKQVTRCSDSKVMSRLCKGNNTIKSQILWKCPVVFFGPVTSPACNTRVRSSQGLSLPRESIQSYLLLWAESCPTEPCPMEKYLWELQARWNSDAADLVRKEKCQKCVNFAFGARSYLTNAWVKAAKTQNLPCGQEGSGRSRLASVKLTAQLAQPSAGVR